MNEPHPAESTHSHPTRHRPIEGVRGLGIRVRHELLEDIIREERIGFSAHGVEIFVHVALIREAQIYETLVPITGPEILLVTGYFGWRAMALPFHGIKRGELLEHGIDFHF